MATWPYPPQGVLEDVTDASAAVVLDRVAPQTMVAGIATDVLTRVFRLRYTVIDSADAIGMRAFFTARRGALESFDFLSPNDGHVYRVRFDSTMAVEYFDPAFFRTGDLTFVVTSG